MKKLKKVIVIILSVVTLIVMFYVIEGINFRAHTVATLSADGKTLTYNGKRYIGIDLGGLLFKHSEIGFLDIGQQFDFINPFERESVYSIENNEYLLIRDGYVLQDAPTMYCLEIHIDEVQREYDIKNINNIYANDTIKFDESVFQYLNSIYKGNSKKQIVQNDVNYIDIKAYSKDKVFYTIKGYIKKLEDGYYYVNLDTSTVYSEGAEGYKVDEKYNDYLNDIFNKIKGG